VGGANPVLAPALADAAHALLCLANSSLSRVGVLCAVAAGPAVAPQLQQLAAGVASGPVALAQQQLAEAGALLLGPTGTTGPEATQSVELRAALAATAALQAVQRAVAVEGLAAVVALRLQEVWARQWALGCGGGWLGGHDGMDAVAVCCGHTCVLHASRRQRCPPVAPPPPAPRRLSPPRRATR
jgi:hypothetical protein